MFAPTNSTQSDFPVALTILDDEVVESVEFMELMAIAQYSGTMTSSNTLIIGIRDNGDCKSLYLSPRLGWGSNPHNKSYTYIYNRKVGFNRQCDKIVPEVIPNS